MIRTYSITWALLLRGCMLFYALIPADQGHASPAFVFAGILRTSLRLIGRVVWFGNV